MAAHLNPRAPPFLPAITSLPSLSDTTLASTLDLLFEPSPELHSLAIPTIRAMSFDSYPDLLTTLRHELLTVAAAVREDPEARARLHAVLGSHPRLGEPRTGEEGSLSAQEQESLTSGGAAAAAASSLPLGAGTAGGPQDGEKEALAALNREYEETFPGLRYVVFVNGRGRDVIMEDMRRRIGRGDLAAEEREAIEAMCDIAADRASKLQASVPAAEQVDS